MKPINVEKLRPVLKAHVQNKAVKYNNKIIIQEGSNIVVRDPSTGNGEVLKSSTRKSLT